MRRLLTSLVVFTLACASPEATSLAPRPGGTGAQVKFDVFHRPLPDIPLPNDFATRFDATSSTKRRLNASMLAPTEWEKKTRASLDELDGWGTLAPITVSFDAPLDVENVIARHHGDRYATKDDVVLVVDVTPGSPDFCQAMPLDLGEGLYPQRLDRPEYYADDPRGALTNLVLEEVEEDTNGNGRLDPGEDTDLDGVLDHPNTRDGKPGSPLISFYERETRTLIARPVYPLREKTTYAVVLTRDLLDTSGQPVRSPFEGINHASQTRALQPLADECLAKLGRGLDDVAFTWSFTTQHWTKPLVAVRDGLYGLGPLARLSTEFPPDLVLREVRARAPGVYTRIAPNSLFVDMAKNLYSQFGSGNSSAQEDLFFDNFEFIDFHAVGTVDSPQFFPRFAEDGKTQLPLTEQVWKLDPETGEAFTRHEGVNYWLMVPKHRTGPAPVAIFIHGHGSTKFDAMNVAGFLARMGIATMGIDAVSHGVDVDPVLLEVVKGQFKQRGLEGMGLGIVEGRALDQNADGKLDSGVDYWTAYIAHTRDVVRQTAVDLFQVIRTLKSFDGQRTWKYDANQDGQPDLAGDLDGDGKVDVGGSAAIHLVGGSLGGIISSYVGGLEPHVVTAIPIIGGGGLGDIGTRSSLSGVRDAMVLRMMAPLILVKDGQVTEFVPDLVEGKALPVATLKTAPKPGSLAVLTNLTTGEWRCARVQPNGHLRVAVPSDKGNRLALAFYAEELPSREREGCEPRGQPTERVAAFDTEFKFQGTTYAAGSDFVAVTDGFGLRRGNPELRRMMGLAQVALEGADPANTAPFLHGDRTLTYGTGDTVQTRVFYINTMGDSGVPTASGVTMSRAAGLVDFRTVDPRYGKTVQQVLLDTGTVESVEASARWKDSTGRNVLMDIDDLANVSTVGDGFDVPRLNPPLRLVRRNTEAQGGGLSAQLFPMMDPLGTHGFPQPKPEKPFDLGSLLINQMIRYLATNGQELDFDRCQLDWSCSWLPPIAP
ncbi:MAG: alpha/beta hydrolase family protein [Myxococcota bacterium]